MRVITAVDPKGGSLLAPITGITSVPSFNRIEGTEDVSVPTVDSTSSGEDIKFF